MIKESQKCNRTTRKSMSVATESPPLPIRLISRNVCLLSVCLFVPSLKSWFHGDWRLLVKEHIANIAKLEDVFFLLLRFGQFFVVVVFVNQPTVNYCEGFIRGRVCGFDSWR